MLSSLWLTQIEAGNFQTVLSPLQLSNKTRSYQGQGFLTWTHKRGVKIDAFTDGGDRMLQEAFAQFGTIGKVMPAESYLRLEGKTRDGWDVTIDRIVPDFFDIHTEHTTAAWRIPDHGLYSSVKISHLNETKDDNRSVAIFSPIELNRWPRASTIVNDNPRFGVPNDRMDWLEFDADVATVAARTRNDKHVVAIIDHKTLERLEVVNAVRLALSFVSGRMVSTTAVETHSSSEVARYLKWGKSAVRKKRFAEPLGWLPINPEPLLAKATTYFAKADQRYVSNMLYACLDSTDNTFTTHAMVICVAVEGLIKEIRRGRGKRKRVSEVLKDWTTRSVLGVVDKDQRAWRSLRNSSAHGELLLLDKAQMQTQIEALSRVKNLINKLILQFMDYEGPYFDYAAWEVKDFPKAISSEL